MCPDVSAAAYCRTGKPDRKSTRLNSSHLVISYAVFCLKKKNRVAVGVAAPGGVGGLRRAGGAVGSGPGGRGGLAGVRLLHGVSGLFAAGVCRPGAARAL